MVKSMTGFGKSTCQIQNKSLSIEVRALNSKSLDISLKIPAFLRDKEQVVRNHIGHLLNRGKIDIVFGAESFNGPSFHKFNKSLVAKYLNELEQIAREHNIKMPDDILSVVIRLPDAMVAETMPENPDDWVIIEQALLVALTQVNQFRISEGEHLAADLLDRIQKLVELAGHIEPYEAQREQTIRARLAKGLLDLKETVQVDPNRFEQELIFYLERLDITEEKTRLTKHLDYFIETLHYEKHQGRKLGFIAQEIGREINTIGSKANDANIQRIVVQMKDELEKIKEQLLNIL